MRLDLRLESKWAEINEEARVHLNLESESKIQVQTYLGVSHACWEITRALVELFPNRKTIGYEQGGGPEFLAIAEAFAKEGFVVKEFKNSELANPTEWTTALAKEMLFVLTSIDNPVTGEINRYSQLDEALKDKRIFRIRVSHAYHNAFKLTPPTPYQIEILSVSQDIALAVLGERAKVQPNTTPTLPWNSLRNSDGMKFLEHKLSPMSETEIEARKARILKFEESLPQGLTPYFTRVVDRIYDRAVFECREMDGLSLITELASQNKNQYQILAPGAETKFETTSLCRWNERKLFSWMQNENFTSDRLRGLVIIDQSILGPNLTNALNLAVREVLAAQG